MNTRTFMKTLSGLAAAGLVSLAAADTLELRDGKSVDGVLIGATGDSLYVRAEGRVQIVNIDEVESIRFEKRPLAQSEAETGDAAQRRAVIVAAGAAMMVSLPQELLQGKLINGDRFTATLSDDFRSGDVVVATKGSSVYGKVVSRESGGLAMMVTDLTVAGDRLPIKTQIRSLPNGTDANVEFRVERPFTLRLASN